MSLRPISHPFPLWSSPGSLKTKIADFLAKAGWEWRLQQVLPRQLVNDLGSSRKLSTIYSHTWRCELRLKLHIFNKVDLVGLLLCSVIYYFSRKWEKWSKCLQLDRQQGLQLGLECSSWKFGHQVGATCIVILLSYFGFNNFFNYVFENVLN